MFLFAVIKLLTWSCKTSWWPKWRNSWIFFYCIVITYSICEYSNKYNVCSKLYSLLVWSKSQEISKTTPKITKNKSKSSKLTVNCIHLPKFLWIETQTLNIGQKLPEHRKSYYSLSSPKCKFFLKDSYLGEKLPVSRHVAQVLSIANAIYLFV